MVGRHTPVRWLLLLLSAACGWFAADRWFNREWHGEKAEAARLHQLYSRSTRTIADGLAVDAGFKSLIQFDDASTKLGIDFVYDDGAAGDYHLMEAVGGGMAVADFDRNGRLDVFFPNGCRLPLDSRSETRRSAFYWGNGSGDSDAQRHVFEVASAAGVDLRLYGHGAAAADFDHDGFEDLLVTGFHALQLFRNQGDGTFAPHAVHRGSAARDLNRLWTSAAWFDADGDGNLDLYVCAYAAVDERTPKDCRRDTIRMHCHPSTYPAEPDLFLRNLGDGRFADATVLFGFSEKDGRGLGIAVADFGGDGKPAVYIANDMTDAYLWMRGPGPEVRYANHAASLGVGLAGTGATMAGMGVAVGDYDRNGLPDLFVTDFYEAGASLFANYGERGFVPKSSAAGLLAPTRRRLGFGTAFLDADLDGWPDLVAVNGHVSDLTPLGIPYKMKAQLFRNEEGRRFADVSNASGEFFRKPLLGRGLATGDFNDDGRPDFVVSNIRDQASLMINQTPNAGAWVGFEFVGTRSAKGSRNVQVVVKCGEKVDRHEQYPGGGFLSSSDPRLIVGLGGSVTAVEEVEVRWPSGVKQRFKALPANRYHLVVEPVE